jgi:hypothetical protein
VTRPRVERLPGGPELVVHDGREDVARRVVEQREEVSRRALRMMLGFLSGSFAAEGFFLDAIEVPPDGAGGDGRGGDVVLTYSYSTDDEPHEYGYTYFDVVLADRHPEPFWPIRFTVGFH